MKENLKYIIAIAGAVILAAALPLLVWKLVPSTGLSPSRNAAGRHMTQKQLAFAGFTTPEATFQTIVWAAVHGDAEKAFACFSPQMQADITNHGDRKKFNADIQRKGQQIQGLQVLARKTLSEDKVELRIKLDGIPTSNNGKQAHDSFIQPMVKIGNEWKLNGSTRPYTPDWDNGSKPVSAS